MSHGQASLGMYDMPALQPANDAFWTAIRRSLGYGPEHLDRTTPLWDIWRAPDLIFAQTCGYPYRAHLHGNVQLIGTPDYALPDCPPGHYRSYIVARSGDLSAQNGACFAFNDPLSQSGWAAPVSHLLEHNIRPGFLLETGGHAASLTAVAQGTADFAGVDAHSYHLLEAQNALPAGLTILAKTAPTPGLPFICGPTQNAQAIRAAVTTAIQSGAAEPLGIRALAAIPEGAYLAVTTPPSAEKLGIPSRHSDA